MNESRFTRRRLLGAAALLPALSLPAAAETEETQVIDLKVSLAFERLKRNVNGAVELAEQAKGVLIIPGITKAGFLVGGLYGEGALRVNDATVGYYSFASASFGLQAGVQRFDQALFFMTTQALERFRRSKGWELGAEAEFVTPKNSLAAELGTTTSRNPIIAIAFGQEGLMGGVSLGGGKYTRIHD
ncbi:MAG: lipid-binding SYLF domain-containing protein [Paracoccaceae bacterium]